LTLSGGIGGAGKSLTVDDKGTVILGGGNGYSGGTAVSAGTLILTDSTSIAAGTSLTIGVGATLIFDSSFVAASNNLPAATSGNAIVTAAVPVYSRAASSSFVLPRPSTAKRIVWDPAWLGQAANSSDNSERRRSKDAASLALDSVFSQYGQQQLIGKGVRTIF